MPSDTVMPARITDERAVLAHLLLDGNAGFFHQSGLRAENFYVPSHRTIWKAIERQFSEPGSQIDPALMVSLLNGDRDAIAHLSACLDGAIRSEGLAFWHAERVRESAEMRAMMRLGQKLTDTASQSDAKREEIISLLESAIAALYAGTENAGCDPADITDSVTETALSKTQPKGVIGTGINGVNHLLNGGLHPGRLYVAAGRPGSGKSVFGLQVMHEAISRGLRVNYHSLEMGREEILQRWLARLAHVSYGAIQHGNVYQENAENLRRASGWIRQHQRQAQIFDRGEQSCSTLQGEIHRWKPNLVILDYVQLADSDAAAPFMKTINRDREISLITKRLKAMARSHGVAVLAMSQLNRDIEKRSGGNPQLSDLRESGGLEADADAVLMIWEPGKTDEKRNRERMIRIAKNRNGYTGTVRLHLQGEFMTLEESGEEL